MTKRVTAASKLGFVAAALALVLAVAACGDLTRPKPQTSNFTDTITVYAVNGTPLDVPTGLWLYGGSAVVLNASFSFDLAFDLDSQGAATMYSVRAVAGGLSTAHRVGLQRSNGSFESLETAPKTGFINDTSFAVHVGDVFVVQSTDPNSPCLYSTYSSQFFAKLQILAIDAGPRTVQTRFTVNPNCGFVSLIPSGVPKD